MRGRGHRAARVGGRRAGREARPRRDRRRGAPRRLRHPLRAARERHARALPRRRRGVRLHDRAAPPRLRARLADQDHGRARHRREARAAGRPHRPVGRRPPRGPARGDPARGARRVRRDAHPRLAAGRDGPRSCSAWATPTARAFSGRDRRHARRHPRDRARPARARPPRSTRRSASSTRPDQDDHDRRGPGRVRARRHQAGPGATRRPASPSPPGCARWSAPTRT